MMIGIILAAVFAASTAYSGMKSGLTVAAGIPVAIIGSMFIGNLPAVRVFLKNIIQGMSSGGESIASGMIYVLPAIILIGSNITFLEGVIVGIGGALFAIKCSAQVYNYLKVEEHEKLIVQNQLLYQ